MITLLSLNTTVFKPFGDSKLEVQRLAGMLLAGVPLPPEFTSFVTYLAELSYFETSDSEMNSCFSQLREKLLKDDVFLLPKVYALWEGEDQESLGCLEYLHYGLAAQLPRLLMEQETSIIQYVISKYHELINNYGTTTQGFVKFIQDNKGSMPPPRNADILEFQVQKLTTLLGMRYVGLEGCLTYPQLMRKWKSVKKLKDLYLHLTEVYNQVTMNDKFQSFVLYYFSKAFSRLSNRIPPLNLATAKQEAEALESYQCLTEPLDLFEIAKKNELESQAGPEDVREVFRECYTHEVLDYMAVRDLFPYQRQLCIDRGLGLFTESPQDLILNQQAIFKGYVI